MQSEVVEKIKKLLRLAKNGAGTPEGDAARSIANRLMEKHGIHVNPEEHKEVIVNDGAHWRSQVLTATARSQGCRVFRNNDDPKELAVIGEQLAVSRAIDMYMMLVPKIVTTCNRMWKLYAEREFERKNAANVWDVYRQAIGQEQRIGNVEVFLSDDGEIVGKAPNEITNEKLTQIAHAWWRAFMNAAADEVVLKYVPPAKIQKPMYYEPWPMEFQEMQQQAARRDKPQSSKKTERELMDKDTRALADLLNDDNAAQALLNTARWQAKQTVANMSPIEYRAGRMLLAASSFLPVPPPPPKPGRFSYLDYE